MKFQICWYHVTFDLDLDLEHTLDVNSSGDHRVQVWSRSSHLPARRSDLRKSLGLPIDADRQTDVGVDVDRRTTDAAPLH